MRATVSVHWLVVAACWILGTAVAVLDAVMRHRFGPLAYVFVAAGATLYIVERVERLSADWLQAYRAGREVSQLRSTKSR